MNITYALNYLIKLFNSFNKKLFLLFAFNLLPYLLIGYGCYLLDPCLGFIIPGFLLWFDIFSASRSKTGGDK